MTEMLCRDCDQIVLFEAPLCVDDPGDESRDDGTLVCVLCGAAVFTTAGWVLRPAA